MIRVIAARTPDPIAAVAEVLRSHGVGPCAARAAGSEGEVLLLRPRDPASEAVLRSEPLLDELREVGFRYVALDLAPPDPKAAG